MLDVLRSGSYEQAEVRQIPRIIQPGERIVELGGGVGFLAVTAAKEAKAEAIAVYEANPKLIPLIERNKSLSKVDFEVLTKSFCLVSRPAPSRSISGKISGHPLFLRSRGAILRK